MSALSATALAVARDFAASRVRHVHQCLDRFADPAHTWLCVDEDCPDAGAYETTIRRCDDSLKRGHQ